MATRMDKTQMNSTLKMMQDAVQNKQPIEQIIDIMNQLKNVSVTEDLIRVCTSCYQRCRATLGSPRSSMNVCICLTRYSLPVQE